MARVVQNPVHPLDLNLNSLMIIYKKFEQAKRLSNNPNQQLPIDLIVQLISRLIEQQPSMLQKQLTKSLYKRTISWNEFLNFLDQESEARENILNWIMYEMNTKQFKFNREVNTRYLGHFDEITYYGLVMCEGRPYSFMLLDKERFVLVDKADQLVVAQLKIQREKQVFTEEKPSGSMLASAIKMNSMVVPKKRNHVQNSLATDHPENSPKVNKPSSSLTNKAMDRSERLMRSSSTYDDVLMEEEQYVVKERKKIKEAFDIFKVLPMESSSQLAEFVSNKIRKRRLGDVNVTEIKQTYKDYLNKRRDPRHMGEDQNNNCVDKIKQYMKLLQDDKRSFSYNPYKLHMRAYTNVDKRVVLDKKRANYEKKQKESDLAVRTLTFMTEKSLVAVALYNFDVVLMQISKEFNKVQLIQHTRIKVPKQPDRKKNEVIEKMEFHFHEILHYYQLLVLIRVEGYSYIRCFNLLQTQTQKGGYVYSLSREVFYLNLNFQAITMVAEKEFGFHVIGYGGWLRSYKDDLTDLDESYTLSHQQKFKGDLVFSCMAVSKSKRKIIFGTVGGTICFFDSFTKSMILTKKVSSKGIVSVIFDDSCNQVLIFSTNEVLIIYDTNKLEEIQVLSVKNEDRLHEKATNFSLSYEKGEAILSFYGSEFRQFTSYVDEDRNNRKRKIECTYHWRLNKINHGEVEPSPKPISLTSVGKDGLADELIGVVETDKYFVTMSQRYQLQLFSRKSYRIKFSLILTLKQQQSLISFNVSADSKILVFSTEDQRLKIMNIYTEQVYQVVNIGQKVTHLQFLSDRNEYFIVTGAECGRVSFVPSYLSQGKLAIKVLPVHKRPITTVSIVGEYLLTAGEDSLLVIWQLPFNIVKFQINLHERRPKDFIIAVNPTKNFRKVFCRSVNSVIYEVDAKEGQIRDNHQQLSVVNVLSCCYSEDLNELYLLDDDLKLSIYQGSLDDVSLNKARSNTSDKHAGRRAATRKDTRLQSVSKKRQDMQHLVDVLAKWRLKSINSIKEKNVSEVTILPNLQMGSIVFFLSKSYFYIYDQLQDRFRGKCCYSTGEFIKNEIKVNNVNPATRTTHFKKM